MAKFFYTPKPRQFDYRPRYYDPEKEARERRREELLGEKAHSDGEYVPGELLRNRRLQRMMDADRNRSMARKKTRSSLFLVMLIVVLIAAAMWLLS